MNRQRDDRGGSDRGSAPQRVLFISYAFPPTGGGGVQRPVKFARYLPRHGWQPTMLTVANPSVPVSDAALLKDVDPELPIVRARTWEPGYAAKRRLTNTAASGRSNWRDWVRRRVVGLLQPDPQVLWNPLAARAAARALRQNRHAAILVSGPPFSSFLLAARLKQQFRLPLVLDFRDEWSMIGRYLENHASDGHGGRQHRMMMRTLAAADAVVATTQASAAELGDCCRAAGSSAIVATIYNGFDPEDLRGLQGERRRAGKFRIVYTGTLWRLTDVRPLVNALETLARQAPELLSRLELVFAGRRTPEQDRVLDRLENLAISLQRRDYLPHDESLQLAASADLLCLLLADEPGAERVVPAKLFEYMALRRPMLALVPAGETQQLVHTMPDAQRFDPHDAEGIADWLAAQLAAPFVASPQPSPLGLRVDDASAAELSRFSRSELTGQLARLLDAVASRRGSGD